MQLGYAIDDIQYGFSAIVNNIPQIVMGLGGGAGLAGALGIAAVAVNQFIKHWGDLTAALQAAWEGGSAERLKVLAERAEEAAEAFDKLAKAPTEREAKAKDIIEKAIVNEPTEKLRKELTDAMMATGHAEPKAKVRENFGALADIPGTPAWVAKKALGRTAKQAEQEQYDATAKKAAGLLGQAGQPGEAGQAARDMINRMIKEVPGAFSQEFKNEMEFAGPEGQKRLEQQRLEAQGERNARKIDQDFAEKHDKMVEAEAKKSMKAMSDTKIFRLEDEQKAVRKSMKDENERMHELQRKAGEHGQIMQGSRAATDYYQQGGSAKAQEALEKAQELRRKQTEYLESIDKEIKKERRLTVPH